MGININHILGAVIKSIFLISCVFGAPNFKNGSTIHNQDEPQSLLNCETSQDYQNLSTFGFNPHLVPTDDSACLAFRMFKEAGLLQQFHIPVEKLSRFILHTKEGYRDVPYHNWRHGFSVLHFAFAVVKNCKVIDNNCFTPLERLALVTAAMCHDLDHPGTNSQFQLATNSSMARAYPEGSILERHHIETTFNLLKNPKNNFLVNLTESDHGQFMHLVKEIILATDLTTHFKTFPEEQNMAREGFNRTNERHHQLFRSIVITSADLSQSTKDWVTARQSTKAIHTEFFNQGTKEKELGLEPAKMMDRKKPYNMAEGQEKFITNVIMPVFRVLKTICPEAQESVNNLENNLEYWQKAIPYFAEQSNRGRDQLEVLNDTELNKIPEEVTKK